MLLENALRFLARVRLKRYDRNAEGSTPTRSSYTSPAASCGGARGYLGLVAVFRGDEWRRLEDDLLRCRLPSWAQVESAIAVFCTDREHLMDLGVSGFEKNG